MPGATFVRPAAGHCDRALPARAMTASVGKRSRLLARVLHVQTSAHGPRGCNNSVPLLASPVASEPTARRGLHGRERACCASRDRQGASLQARPCPLQYRHAASTKRTHRISCVTANPASVRARRRNGYQQRELGGDAVAKRYHTWGAPGSPLAAVPRRPACCMRLAREHLLTWSDGAPR